MTCHNYTLDKFVLCIDKIVKSQLTEINESFGRSEISRCHKHNIPCFSLLHYVVSNEALDLMVKETERSNSFQLDSSTCGCQLHNSCGLSCACRLALYVNSATSHHLPFTSHVTATSHHLPFTSHVTATSQYPPFTSHQSQPPVTIHSRRIYTLPFDLNNRMDKSWMRTSRTKKQYIDGVEAFIKYAIHNLQKMRNIDPRGLMHKKFQMSPMRELTFFLELQVMHKDDEVFNSQDKYVADILKKIDMDVDVHLYRLMIGSLMYLTATRPDIMFAVYACVRFQVTPKFSHLHVVKRIFRYLKSQPKLDLWYPKDSPFDLEAFFDSDYAEASLDRKSITGGC
nr:hypothetical protein [Tanacetum cinerariifolium]